MAHFVHEGREKIDALDRRTDFQSVVGWNGLKTRSTFKLAVVARGFVDEPGVSGGGAADLDEITAGLAEVEGVEVGKLEAEGLEALFLRGGETRGFPAGNGLGGEFFECGLGEGRLRRKTALGGFGGLFDRINGTDFNAVREVNKVAAALHGHLRLFFRKEQRGRQRWVRGSSTAEHGDGGGSIRVGAGDGADGVVVVEQEGLHRGGGGKGDAVRRAAGARELDGGGSVGTATDDDVVRIVWVTGAEVVAGDAGEDVDVVVGGGGTGGQGEAREGSRAWLGSGVAGAGEVEVVVAAGVVGVDARVAAVAANDVVGDGHVHLALRCGGVVSEGEEDAVA